MFSKKNTQHLDALDALSTQELEAIIQADRQQKTTDDLDAVYEALAILEERDALESCHADVDAAWKEFQTHYNIPEGDNAALYPSELPTEGAAAAKKKKRSIWKAISTAAAVFVLMMLMAAPVFGEKSLIQYVGQWTKDVFSFSDGEYHDGYAEEGNGDIAFKNDELINVCTEVLMQGCEARVVPTWLPDGYVLRELYSSQVPSHTGVHALFENDENTISMYYAIHNESSNSNLYHEKGEGELNIIEIAGIDHYFFQNASRSVCCWVTDGVECSISGNIAREELQKIVRSIYSEVEESEENN